MSMKMEVFLKNSQKIPRNITCIALGRYLIQKTWYFNFELNGTCLFESLAVKANKDTN